MSVFSEILLFCKKFFIFLVNFIDPTTSVEVHFLMMNSPNCDCNTNTRWTRGFPQTHPCRSKYCTGALLLKIGQYIENAWEYLDIAMYNLTSVALKRNIVYAHRLIASRGWGRVRLLVDRSQFEDEDGSMGNIVRDLINAGKITQKFHLPYIKQGRMEAI